MDFQIKKSNLELVKDLLKDPDRKSLFRIVYEVLILLFTYREIPLYYFSRYVFKKQIKNFRDFLPDKLVGRISVLINDHRSKDVLDNKLFFNFFYSQFDLKLPKILLYNHRTMFIVDSQAVDVKDYEDFIVLMDEIFRKNSASDSLIIKKTSASSSGKKIFKLTYDQVRTGNEIVKEIYSEVIQSDFLFQETIRQHPALDRMNPSCLNTIRIDTFINPDSEIEIGSAYLRMSICNSHIDNISTGGCQVGIDLSTGKLKQHGYSLFHTVGMEILTEHPVTKTKFDDFVIPCFPEVMDLVIKTARLMPGLRLIGWDVAIGESGPVLVEGNSDYDLSGNDLAFGGYMANDTFRKVLKELNIRNGRDK